MKKLVKKIGYTVFHICSVFYVPFEAFSLHKTMKMNMIDYSYISSLFDCFSDWFKEFPIIWIDLL